MSFDRRQDTCVCITLCLCHQHEVSLFKFPFGILYMLATAMLINLIFSYLICNPNEMRMKHILVPVSPSYTLSLTMSFVR